MNDYEAVFLAATAVMLIVAVLAIYSFMKLKKIEKMLK